MPMKISRSFIALLILSSCAPKTYLKESYECSGYYPLFTRSKSTNIVGLNYPKITSGDCAVFKIEGYEIRRFRTIHKRQFIGHEHVILFAGFGSDSYISGDDWVEGYDCDECFVMYVGNETFIGVIKIDGDKLRVYREFNGEIKITW